MAGKILPDYKALYEQEKAKREAAEKARERPITLKVSEKGALSVYGLGRFPTTLYQQQWLRLLADDEVKRIKKFIADNQDKLSEKPEKE